MLEIIFFVLVMMSFIGVERQLAEIKKSLDRIEKGGNK